jgi:hypothetical protein
MAHVALMAEIILHMVGIVRRCKIIFMAGKTISGKRGELTVFVAAFADKGLMCAGQRKRGQVVIELCRLPGTLVVADQTIDRELVGGMVRGSGCIEIALVAANTFPR